MQIFNNLFRTLMGFQRWSLKRKTGVGIADQIILVAVIAGWLAAGYFSLRLIAFAGYIGFGTLHNIMNLSMSFWIFTILGLVGLGLVMRRSVLKKWAAEEAQADAVDLDKRLNQTSVAPSSASPTHVSQRVSGGNGASGSGTGSATPSGNRLNRPVSGGDAKPVPGNTGTGAKPAVTGGATGAKHVPPFTQTPAQPGTGTGAKPAQTPVPPAGTTVRKTTPGQGSGSVPSLLTRVQQGGTQPTTGAKPTPTVRPTKPGTGGGNGGSKPDSK